MLRNREIKQLIIIISAITAVAAAAGFIITPAAAILTLITALALCSVFFLFTRARYKSLAKISEQIDEVLHDADLLYVSQAEEGELSILQTEISKMTQHIREQNNTLKMEKKHLADSLADTAHQLRTPLTSVTLILSLLENNHDETEKKALLREAEQLLSRMDWLLSSLLKLSRLDAGIVEFCQEKTDADKLIHSALHPLQIPMELHEISLCTDIPHGIKIYGDSLWLSEALGNILKNSIESAGDGGEISISCTDNPIFTEITICDNGPGFQNEDLPHVFERFYRSKDSEATGYGIGLALCRMIITRHNGTITARNHPRGGALFNIRFPK